MPSRDFQQFTALVVLSALSFGCGDKASKQDISEPPLRAGAPLQLTKPKFIDHKPALSGDGTRVTFVSGRESTDELPVFKAFKATWPADGAPSAPVRVTADASYGDEKEVALSADGKLVAITSVVNLRSDVILVSFDDGAKVQRVTDDAAYEERPMFSHDSKLLAWISLENAAGGTASLKLADVSTGVESALPAAKLASGTGEHVLDAFWVPVESGYALAVGTASTAKDARIQYKLLRFNAFADLDPQAATDWVNDFQPLTIPVRAASKTKVLFGRRTPARDQKRVDAAGDVTSAPFTSGMISDPWVVDVTQKTAEGKALASPVGYELLAADVAKDGETFFTVARNAYRCAAVGGGAVNYGSAFALVSSDLNSTSFLSPRVENASGDFAMVQGFCDRPAPTPGSMEMRIDDKIFDARVNADAVAKKYRMAYVSRFSSAFDASCHLKVGDPEVLLVDFNGSEHKILPLSKNKEPMENDQRPEGAAPCP